MTKKIGFWKWLLKGTKEIPLVFIEIGKAMKDNGTAQALIGFVGISITTPLIVFSVFLFPIPIFFGLMALYGIYNLGEE